MLLLLLAWQFVDFVSLGAADHHPGLIATTAIFLYFAVFSLFLVPAHVIFRDRGFAPHSIALGLVTLAFAVLMAFAFPISGVPI